MGGVNHSLCGQRKNGEIFPISTAISKLEVNGQRCFNASIRDISQQKQIEKENSILVKTGEILASSLDYKLILENIALQVINKGISSQCIIGIKEEKAITFYLYSKDFNNDQIKSEQYKLSEKNIDLDHYFENIYKGRDSIILKDGNKDDLNYLDDINITEYKSLLSIPIISQGKVSGNFTFISHNEKDEQNSLQFKKRLARGIGLSIEKTRLFQ